MGTVLVVDDEPEIRDLIRINLELDGHAVLTAADGAEAIEYAVGEHPDVIVLDVMMPEVDGYAVLAELKSTPDPAVADIPVVLLTAKVGDYDRARGGIEGAVLYLTKPFSPDKLRAEVRQLMDEGEPEPAKRRRAQTEGLALLARLESTSPAASPTVRPHLTRLERPIAPAEAEPTAGELLSEKRLATLSDKQRDLLRAIGSFPTVTSAADDLGVSRSNVYGSLRRIARRLEIRSVSLLLTLARQRFAS